MDSSCLELTTICRSTRLVLLSDAALATAAAVGTSCARWDRPDLIAYSSYILTSSRCFEAIDGTEAATVRANVADWLRPLRAMAYESDGKGRVFAAAF